MKALTIAILLSVVSTAQAAGNDQAFVTKAGQGHFAEIEMGNTAASPGTNPLVRQFGTHMVTDHTKASDALKLAATADGLMAPAEPSAEQKATGEKMKAMQGTAFDKAYAADMVKDHKADIALFEKEAKSGMSPKVKAYAQDTLPTLKDHLKMAEDMKAGIK